MTNVPSVKFNNSGFSLEEALQNNMFPFCLINASVTDAEGIRSRLVSFPWTLFSSVCHIAFPMVLFKKQTGSAFPVFLFTQPLLLFLSNTSMSYGLHHFSTFTN